MAIMKMVKIQPKGTLRMKKIERPNKKAITSIEMIAAQMITSMMTTRVRMISRPHRWTLYTGGAASWSGTAPSVSAACCGFSREAGARTQVSISPPMAKKPLSWNTPIWK